MTFTKRELEIIDIIFDHGYMELLHSLRMIEIHKEIPEEMAETIHLKEKLVEEFKKLSNKIDRMREELDNEELK